MAGLESQMRRRDVEMVPRILVQGMFAVMLGALALVFFATLTDRPKVGVLRPAPVVAELEVRLSDAPDGVATAIGPDGAVLARSDEPRMGFIGVMQRMVGRERTRQGLPDEAPVRVVRRANGHIGVIDPATGLAVELLGYGKDNVAAFAGLVR